MKTLRLLLAALCLTAAAHAQVALSASHIDDAFGIGLPSARLCFAPVDAANNPTGFRVGSIQVVPNEVCGKIANGALVSGGPLQPSPVGTFYHIYVKASNSNVIIRDYGMIPITGSTFTMDTYDPSLATVPVTVITFGTVTMLPPGSGGSCGIVGSSPYVLNCSIPTGATGSTGPAGPVASVAGSGTELQARSNGTTLQAVAGSSWDGTTLGLPQVSTVKLKGSTSGVTTVQTFAVAGGTVSVPSVTDTLVGRDTTDTFTHKTFDTAGTGNSFSINGLPATANTGTGAVVRSVSPAISGTVSGNPSLPITGVTTNSNAAAGIVGEYVSGAAGPVSLTTSTGANVTSVSLTAGDWDVSASCLHAISVAATYVRCTIATTTGTVSNTSDGSSALIQMTAATELGTIINTGVVRVSLASTTTYYLNADASFSSGTVTATGTLRARRIR